MFADMFILNVNAMYAKRSYTQDVDKYRDDSILAFGSGFYWLYGKHMAYAKAKIEKYSAKDKDAIPPIQVFVDKTISTVAIGGLYSFENILDLRADLQYRKGDFEEIPVAPFKRDDTNKDIQISVERDLSKELRSRVQVHSVDNTSNYGQAIYTKHEILVGLIYTY